MTTVMQKSKPKPKITGLKKWIKNSPHSQYVVRFASDIGTDTHKLIENYLSYTEETESCHLLAFAYFSQLKSLLDKFNNVHGLEVFLNSKIFKVAGTADTIADYDGKLSIIYY